ncbi:MAG: choice-of-anchor D domain-containing protein [Calditrichaeota bacterium]|nr:MAG: choice-of-anchor D domain-containing protein [Calditrichota bacterium]
MKISIALFFLLLTGGMMLYPQNCDVASVGLPPINDLGTNFWQGFQGGLYPNGSNQRPVSHDSAGIALATTVQPLDVFGNPDSVNGKIVLLSIGMSNTNYEFEKFQQLANNLPNKNPYLEIVQGAQPNKDIIAIVDTNDSFWSVINDTLLNRGLSPQQVQTIWFKEAEVFPQDTTFPGYANYLKDLFRTALNIIQNKFPNVKQAFLSSRIYGGYAVYFANPEPFAYFSGWSVKFLIEDQVNGDSLLNYKGPHPRAPWLSWAAYLWADGMIPRNDGLIWECPLDFEWDGLHPSDPWGRLKVANLLLDFFSTDVATVPWFFDSATIPDINVSPASVDFGNVGINTTVSQTVTITNSGLTDLMITGATLTGGNTSEFTISNAIIPQLLHPGESSSLDVSFTPTTTGVKTATLQLTSNDPNETPLFISLTGTGISQQSQFLFAVNKDWNLVGLPLLVPDNFYLSVYPNAIPGTLFGWDGQYVAEDSLQPGHGYWLRFPVADTVVISGTFSGTQLISLKPGWNMISGASCDIALVDVIDPQGIIVPSTLYGFDQAYFLADSILQGRGYWIRASDSGQVILNCGGGLQSISKSNPSEKNREKTFQPNGLILHIQDHLGAAQRLYFDVDPNSIENPGMFELPPLPPPPLFDVRFANNTRLSLAPHAQILIQGGVDPVQIRVEKIPSEKSVLYLLEVESGNHVETYHLTKALVVNVHPRGSRVFLHKQKVIPSAVILGQNYPNPFNPMTVIPFQISRQGKVSLVVYNTLGQVVRSLVDETLTPGFYEFSWDGRDDSGDQVSSGVYLYRLEMDGKPLQIRKMVLMR